MTPTEAWSELQLEPGTGRDQVRRAYLRRLKTCKPESDPEGFMRLREAYDLARRLAPALDDPSDEAGPPAAPGARARGHAQGDDAPDAAPPARDRRAEGRSEREEPGEDGQDRRGEGEQDRRGERGQGEQGRQDGPSEPGAQEEPGEQGEESTGEGDEVAEEDRAWIELADAYERSTQDEGVEAPPAWMGLDMLLMLVAEGRRSDALELRQAFMAWLEHEGEARALGPSGSIGWALFEEIIRLHRHAPRPVIKAIARAARRGDLGRALGRIDRLREEDPGRAAKLSRYLASYAPMLARAYANRLGPPPDAPRPSHGISWAGALFTLTIVLRLVSAGRSGTEAPRPIGASDQRRLVAAPDAPTAPQARLAFAGREIAAEARKQGLTTAPVLSGDVVTRAKAGDCAAARQSMQALLSPKDPREGPLSPVLWMRIQTLREDLDTVCALGPTTPETP